MGIGEGWEAELRSYHAAYRRAGTAHVVKVDQPIKRIRTLEKGRFVAVNQGQGPVDFIGVVQGGRAVAFDAKRTMDDGFSVSSIPKHQRADLDRWLDLGAAAFVALRCTHGQSGRYVLPWREVRATRGPVPLPGDWQMDAEGWLCRLSLL